MARRFLWLPAVVLLTAALGRAAPTPEPKDDGRVHFLPGAVTDAALTKGFVANAAGGVTAFDLESGKSLWEYKEGGVPLAVADGRLWVQVQDKDRANVLRVVGLGVDDGKPAAKSDAIALPDWVIAEPGPGPGHSFDSSAYRGGGDLFLKWQADTFYWSGVPATPERLKAATRHAEGVARVHLGSGKVEMLETAKAPPPPDAPAPNISKELMKAAARLYCNGPEAAFQVATAGNYAAAVDFEVTGADHKIVLKRWDLTTEKPLDPVVLAVGPAYRAVTLPSLGATLVRKADLPDDAPEADRTWVMYSLETGKEMGRFATEANTAEMTMLGPRIIYVARGPQKSSLIGPGRTLKALDPKTGKARWEQPIENEKVEPPPPP
jgi:hypothetical protein